MRVRIKWPRKCRHIDFIDCPLLVLIVFLLLLFFMFCYIAGDLLERIIGTDDSDKLPISLTERPSWQHKLCVIVPYRDRFEELNEFAPHLTQFLNKNKIDHEILVLNQTDQYRFNRASLINVGWNEADRLRCDYLVMHDVDLLPLNSEIDYGFPGIGIVRHISSPQYHPKYNYTNFIGGILMLTLSDYKLINGMSNKYWGWGLEDDEFFLRIKESKLNLTRVSNLSTDRKTSFRHIHGPERKRDYAVVTKDQRAMKRKRDKISGLHNVRYSIVDRRVLEIDSSKVRVIDVHLYCDMSWTPYCKLPS